MKKSRQIFYICLIAAWLVTPVTTKANTIIEPVDACTDNNQKGGNCQTLRDNFRFYMDVHRRGGTINNSYLFKTYWEDTVYPGLRNVLHKITASISKNTIAQGGFLEGQDNIRGVSALQEESARTARDFLPSEQLCRFGSLSQSLAADDANMRTAQIAIAGTSLKRDLGSRGSIAQAGAAEDQTERMNEFIREYSNRDDAGLSLLRSANSQRSFPNTSRDTRYNRDINYARTIDGVQSYDANMVGGGNVNPQQQDVMALSNNLYGNKQFSGRVTERQMNTVAGQNTYLQTRSVASARSVAQNTYAAITAMKTNGSGSSQRYMKAVLEGLGLPADQMAATLGDKPSYYAQMDVLTKKLYQNPGFYVNLMEGKTNVARQSDAMEGVELMQDRDIYNSMRRSEMLLAILVQLQTRKELNNVVEKR